jgi:glycosyltransferase involved in cell wall biosynthesis
MTAGNNIGRACLQQASSPKANNLKQSLMVKLSPFTFHLLTFNFINFQLYKLYKLSTPDNHLSPMAHHLTLYESSSFGGNYQYALSLLKAYQAHPDVATSTLLLPRNAAVQKTGARNILCKDNPAVGKKVHFIYRHFMNPLKLLLYLWVRPKQVAILNDFEQNSAWLWVPLYKLLLKKHSFIVVLHDPDRDAYPPSPGFASAMMKKILSLCRFALYHEHLPEKNYYNNNGFTQYIPVPHGLYSLPVKDEKLYRHLKDKKKEDILISILGNIRAEKNYDLVFRAVSGMQGIKLLIAGKPSSTGMNLEALKDSAYETGIAEKVIWIDRYLTDAEMAACIEASDIILLYYASSFTSQSGIINLVAPFQKPIMAARSKSSLSAVIGTFGLGQQIEPDSETALKEALQKMTEQPVNKEQLKTNWDRYCTYASWENHVNTVIGHLNHNLYI